MEELKKWVQEELTVSETSDLVRNRDKVKKAIRITIDGRIIFNVDLTGLSAKQIVSLYMIGKVYANVAGYVDTETVSNRELSEELRMPGGTIGFVLMELRNERTIVAEKAGVHRILYSEIEQVLDSVLGANSRGT